MKIKYDEFDIDNEGKRNKKITYIVVGVILLLFIILVVFLIFNNKSNGNDNVNNIVDNNQYFISLTGETSISIYQGDTYVELGYQGYDKYNNDLTDNVIVNNGIDTSKIGTYTISYELNGTVVTRTVNVVEKPIGATYIYLYDLEDVVYLNIGDTYKDPGYIVVDTVDNNLTDKVKVENNIDTSKSGSYEIIYSVVNSSGVTTTAVRRIEVLGGTITLKLSNNKSTPDPVYINVVVTDNNFSYLILPNGNKVTKKETSYKVTTNGTYKFVSYDKFGTKTEASIVVSNIKVDTGSSSSGSSDDNTGSSSTPKPTVTIDLPKVYTSDNIESGETHPVRFMIKLISSGNTIYYCEDESNKCDPTTKYTSQIVIPKSVKKYIRYKACDSSGNCSNVGSYYVVCSQNLVSKGADPIANANGAKFYYQCDSSWSYKYLPGSKYTFCSGGCGYTSLAMVMTGLTKNYNITPVTILNDLKNTSGYYYTDSSSKGMMFHSAMWKDYLVEKYNYGVDRLFFNYSSLPEENVSSSGVKDRFEESLKMGHMIVTLVPNHYIALVGYTSDNYVIVYDPANGSEYRSISGLYNYYYDYKNRCTNNGDCGFGLAYEFYPKDGMSLDEWRKIK